MTYEEAVIRAREMLKIDIRSRLHKYNPTRYPKPIMYSDSEALDVCLTLIIPKMRSVFERDDYFYNCIRKKV